ncbi:MAG: N-acetyltransferase family protein [Bryobacteraceae bacterium]|jgi:L-amino acid N-acyltransferase YncA
MHVAIHPLSPADWPAARAIYLEGIATGNATFETEAPEWEAWSATHAGEYRLVASLEGEIAGWAALSPVSSRCVYAGVAEVSVYVAAAARGSGVGTALLAALIEASEASDVWTLQAGIFPENTASVALFTKAGFRTVGHRERIGRMDGRWRDTLLFERRSRVVGTS